MKPARILHLLGSSGHEGTGIARIVSTLAQCADPQRYSPSAYFFGQDGPLSQDFKKKAIATRVIKWRHPGRDLIGLLALWKQLRKERFDIVHVHWGGRVVRWVAKQTGAKIVLHLHGRTDEINGRQSLRLSTEHADAVISVCQAVATASTHKNTRVIYSGVDSYGRISRTQTGMTIGSAGRLTSVKGITHLLRAMALLRPQFPDLRLEIAGTGPEQSNLVSEASALGLNCSVQFLGWVTDLRPEFARWRILVQPSLEEGLPISILEAMSAGLPVIASKVGGIPEIIKQDVTGRLVPPADPTALAECIRGMLLDSDSIRKMGEAATARIQQAFSSQLMVDSILKIYDELLTE